jgi:hydrogenase expression/formation protein HypE
MKGLVCPAPILTQKNITLAHGGGGRLMNNLINEIFLPAFNNKFLERKHDGAVLDINKTKLAFTTDSYVVKPLFFPGGDIGSLAVYGTVNDLAMCGASPLYLSTGLILEEGFSTDDLLKITTSMQKAAEITGVQLVTGDTKVVDKGKGDGIFINTTGVGVIEYDIEISPAAIKENDVIILNGDIGRHGIAIMSVREGLEFESSIKSDLDFLSGIVNHLLKERVDIHCLRDLTRGGLASALVEIAESANLKIELDENEISVTGEVQGACEILGLDPLYVANEGRFITICPKNEAQKIIDIMKSHPQGKNARIIGKVKKDKMGLVTIKGKLGTERIIDMLSGEQLPRIC